MRTLKTLALAAALGAAAPAWDVVAALAQTCTCPPTEEGSAAPRASRAQIIADEPPPPLPEYEQPPLPSPGYMWTPGYWSWNNYEYYWVPGTWVAPPRVGLLWTPGYWGFADGDYVFHRGYWGQHVGFYGGVAYGFGYYGGGFEGGRWDGDRFFYNRTVNNFGSVNVVNVYEHPVPRVVERVSFNGGEEGVRAKPTAQEIVAAKEAHVPPTAEQRHNASVASRTESSFVSVNKGKPAVAATAKPGELTGAAVVPAKAAGGPLHERKPEAPTPPPGPAKAESATPSPEATPTPKMEKMEKSGPKADKMAPARTERPTPPAKEEKAVRPAPEPSATPSPEPKADTERPTPGQPKVDRAEERKEKRIEERKQERKDERKDEKPRTEAAPAKPAASTEIEPKAEPMKPARRAEAPAKAEPARPAMRAEAPPKAAEPARPAMRAETPPKAAEHRAASEPARCHPGAPNCPK